MYKEIAFDPKCLADIDYYRLIKREFGFDKGRYIAADRKKWVAEAMQWVKASSLQEVKKKSVKNFLNSISRNKNNGITILPIDRRSFLESDWSVWHAQQHAQRRFEVTISLKPIPERLTVDDIDELPAQWVVPASLRIKRTSTDIVSAIGSLLRISQQLTIIDPYFRLTNNNTFKELLKSEFCKNLSKITIVTALSNADAKRVFEKEYQEINKHCIEVKWIRVPDKYFHARYAITDFGAVRSDPGFMEQIERGINADYAPINIISKVEADKALADLEELLQQSRAIIEFSV